MKALALLWAVFLAGCTIGMPRDAVEVQDQYSPPQETKVEASIDDAVRRLEGAIPVCWASFINFTQRSDSGEVRLISSFKELPALQIVHMASLTTSPGATDLRLFMGPAFQARRGPQTLAWYRDVASGKRGALPCPL